MGAIPTRSAGILMLAFLRRLLRPASPPPATHPWQPLCLVTPEYIQALHWLMDQFPNGWYIFPVGYVPAEWEGMPFIQRAQGLHADVVVVRVEKLPGGDEYWSACTVPNSMDTTTQRIRALADMMRWCDAEAKRRAQ